MAKAKMANIFIILSNFVRFIGSRKRLAYSAPSPKESRQLNTKKGSNVTFKVKYVVIMPTIMQAIKTVVRYLRRV